MSPSLLQRVDRLERENRRLKAVGLTVLVLIIAVMLMGQTFDEVMAAHVMMAREFILMDEHGNTRASFGLTETGHAGLWFYDDDQTARLALGFDWAGPRLSFVDTEGETRAALGLGDGKPTLDMYDADGEIRIGLRLHAGGDPHLGMTDDEGNVIFSAP